MAITRLLSSVSCLPCWALVDIVPSQLEQKRQPLARVTLSDQIAEQLRDDIVRAVFDVGEQLHEVQLAEGFGVSRGPLREAMQQLIHEGLLHREPNRGVFVPELSRDDLLDIYFVRSSIETAALRRIMTDGDRKAASRALTEIAGRMHVAVTSERWGEGSELDFLFHRTLVDAAGSRRLSRTYLTIQAETRLCLHRLMGGYRNSKALAKEHHRLARLIGSGDEEVAHRALAEHFLNPARAFDKLHGKPTTDVARS